MKLYIGIILIALVAISFVAISGSIDTYQRHTGHHLVVNGVDEDADLDLFVGEEIILFIDGCRWDGIYAWVINDSGSLEVAINDPNITDDTWPWPGAE
jgi:hypothetical protein